MKCPNCGAEMSGALNGFWDCNSCFLCGAAEAIEALSRRLSPEGVMDEAERLLREARPRSGYIEVVLHGERVTVSETYDGKEIVDCRSLSAAYAKLVANNPERPDSSGGG